MFPFRRRRIETAIRLKGRKIHLTSRPSRREKKRQTRSIVIYDKEKKSLGFQLSWTTPSSPSSSSSFITWQLCHVGPRREIEDQVTSDNVTLCLRRRNIQSSIFFFFSNCRRKSIDERKELFSFSSLLYCEKKERKRRRCPEAFKRFTVVRESAHTRQQHLSTSDKRSTRRKKRKENR